MKNEQTYKEALQKINAICVEIKGLYPQKVDEITSIATEALSKTSESTAEDLHWESFLKENMEPKTPSTSVEETPINEHKYIPNLTQEDEKEWLNRKQSSVHDKANKFALLTIEKYPLKHPHAHSTANAEIIEKRRDFISGLDEGYKIGRISAIQEIDQWAQENTKIPKPNTTSGVAYALAHNELLTKLISMLN